MNKQPKDLDEVVDLLIEEIQKQDAEEAVVERGIAHHGAGTSIRNYLHLWWQPDWPEKFGIEKPPLVEWFNQRNIFHADDMSGTITEAVQAKLSGKPFDLDEHLKVYLEHWKQQGFKDGVFRNEE